MKTIASFLFSFICLALISCQTDTSQTVKPLKVSLIPYPQELVVKSEVFRLSQSSSFAVSDADQENLQSIVNYFNDKLEPVTGYVLPVKKKGSVRLELAQNNELGEEGYHLEVTPSQITISAPRPAGIFYGLQTLIQLMPEEIKSAASQAGRKEWEIPCVSITDKPEFAYRGLMLDVSRHWFTKEEVMAYIDQMAEYKYNVFHWHLTDDQGWRIEIKELPQLTNVAAWRVPRVGQWWQREPAQPGEAATYGGYYTQEDIKEVVAYAAERFVRVIPEINVPGHSLEVLVAYPELACIKAPEAVNVGNKFYTMDENSLCVGKEATFEFLEKVFAEVVPLFPDEYIHIGGDECYKGFWKKCPHCQKRLRENNLKNEEELQSYFIRRVSDMLEAKGKKIIGWDEILEGGLANGATVMSWRGMRGGIQAAKAGHQVIMTPNRHCYLDLWQGEPSVEPDTYSMCRLSDSFNFNPVPDTIPKELILGGQGSLWAESLPTFRHAQYMTWPRGWAIAEVLWTGPGKTEWVDFYQRVEDHFVRAGLAEINYARSMYNAIIDPYLVEGETKIELKSELENIDIYYTFDNTDPDRFTPKYDPDQPLSIPKDATWLRVVTYRGGKPVGKVITLTTEELRKRAASNRRRVVGNLNLN